MHRRVGEVCDQCRQVWASWSRLPGPAPGWLREWPRRSQVTSVWRSARISTTGAHPEPSVHDPWVSTRTSPVPAVSLYNSTPFRSAVGMFVSSHSDDSHHGQPAGRLHRASTRCLAPGKPSRLASTATHPSTPSLRQRTKPRSSTNAMVCRHRQLVCLSTWCP